MGGCCSSPEASEKAYDFPAPEPAPAVKGALSLPAVLADKEASNKFMAFAVADMSEENLEFYLAVNDYKIAFDAKAADDEAGRIELSRTLIELYLKSGAEKQVCIGDRKVVSIVEDAAAGKVHREMFETAQITAAKTLGEDIFPRFQDSHAGHELALRPELCDHGATKRMSIVAQTFHPIP